MRAFVYIFGTIAMVVLFSSMQFEGIRNDAIRQLMEERLQNKIDRLKERKLASCRTKAIDAARIYIDSLVAVEFGLSRTGTLTYPQRPERPQVESSMNIPIDSSPIIPLFDPKVMRDSTVIQ